MTNIVGNVTDKKWCGSFFPYHLNGKIIFAAFFVALFLLTGIAGAYSGGDGSVGSPYQISNRGDLMLLSMDYVHWDNNFIVMNDIDLTGYYLSSPIGNKGNKFTGSFDGQGYTISNFVMNKPDDDYVGLFGLLGIHGQITDLGIEAGAIGVIGKSSAGVLVGHNYGTIRNCYATGNVTAFDMNAGGLVGYNYCGILTNCYATGSATADSYAGGLVGVNFGFGSITNCYAMGTVTATGDYAGGLVGYNKGSLKNCYATGSATAADNAGGLVGYNHGTFKNCYRYTDGGTDFGTHISDITKFRDYDFITGTAKKNGLKWSTDIISTSSDPSKIWFVPFSKTECPTFQSQHLQLYSGGSGTTDDPYQISNSADLRALSKESGYWGKKFIVTDDIDLTGDCPTSTIGNEVTKFTGSFDGQGYTISNFEMNKPDVDYVGLFGYLDFGGDITNLEIETGTNNGVSGWSDVGVLVGWNSGSVTNCSATGTVTATGSYAGGLVGSNSGSVTNCSATGTVTANEDFAGGLVGSNSGHITNCFATGSATATGFYAGGLVGYNNYYALVSYCYATGSATATGSYAGGLVGYDGGSISNCYAMGNATAAKYAGGLAGYDDGSISNCYAMGNATAAKYAGGLAGYDDGSISNCYATGNAIADWYAGGLIGYNLGPVMYCYATGNTTATGCDAGGLVGYNKGDFITKCYATGTVTATDNDAGGLVGWNEGDFITNCYATGTVTAGRHVGGLVGSNFASITNCYATGNAIADWYAGGLVGSNFEGTLTNCYATGSVTATIQYAGGLVSQNYNYGTLENCYATGNATAGDYAGGLVGWNTYSTLKNCYATGTATADDYAGGLVGTNTYSVSFTNCYATGTATGASSFGGLVGWNDDSSLNNCYRYSDSGNSLGTHISDLTRFRDYDFITNTTADKGLNWPTDIISTDADLWRTWRVFTYKCHDPTFQWQSVETGTLQVQSTPEGATVSFNGVGTGESTNYIFSEQPAGAYNITVVCAGHTFAPECSVVYLTDGETKEVTFSLAHETGSLQINSTPSGADIYLDGILNASVTNATLTGLVVGTYNVTIVLDDYETAINDTVTVTSDATTPVFFDLVNQTDDSLIDPTPYHHVSDGDDNPAPYVAQTSMPALTPVPTTITPTPEATATPTPGTLVPKPAVLTGTTELPVGPNGEVESRVTLWVDDMSGYLTIDAGVVARDASGNVVDTVGVVAVPVATILSPGEIGAIEHPRTLYVFNCTPEGVTFSPAISLTFTLTEDEWNRYGKEAEVGWFNSTSEEWEIIAGVTDATRRTITISVSHFSTYALFAEYVPEVALPDMTGVPAGSSAGQSLWVWGGLIFVVVILGGILFIRNREEK